MARKPRRYDKVKDGERFLLPRTEWIACCDCGLVHRWRTQVRNKSSRPQVFATLYRDPRATAGVRRGMR